MAARFSDNRLRQVLGYPAVFLGSSPSRAPSLYHLMSRLDLGDRVLYPQGGFTRLIEVIAALAERHGARLHTGATSPGSSPTRPSRRPAARDRGGAHGADGAASYDCPADVVVGAADLHHLETALLPAGPADAPASRRGGAAPPGPEPCSRCWASRAACPQLAHHSLFFTSDWDQNFGDIFGDESRVPSPASIYVCKPSRDRPDRGTARAARTSSSWCRCRPTWRSARGGDDGQGSEAVERAADAAIDQVAGGPGSPTCATGSGCGTRSVPRTSRVATTRGAAERSASSTPCARARSCGRATSSSKVDGLLYAGASTVPGVGLPMCLISAELVLKRLTGDRSSLPVPG